ncbi:glycosyltransferase [Microbacterium sp.]|uniref:glycosyltransferase n=1 Tax=Microbacterium sp. TaxID=51671 RepID=UPI003C742335
MAEDEASRTPRVGAVVLTWRDRSQTAQCVSELLTSPAIVRVVAVDNEADGTITAALPADARVSVVELAHNTGFAVGVNTGMRALLQDPAIELLLVINNDATITPAGIALLTEALSTTPSLGLVGPRIVTPEGREFSAGGVVNRITWGIRQPRPGEVPDFLTWACVLVRRETLDTVGMLDERFFMYWEDVEFGMRASDHGVAFAEVAGARLVHAVSSSHARAGSRILAYSSQAFRHFLRLRGGATRITGYLRLLAKVMSRVLVGDGRGARYVIAGWRIGRRTPDPAYPALDALP